MAEVTLRQVQMPISRMITRIAFPELRGPSPSMSKVKYHAWHLRAMYRQADWRDANIMLMREKCPARGPVAKMIALELRRTT